MAKVKWGIIFGFVENCVGIAEMCEKGAEIIFAPLVGLVGEISIANAERRR